MSRSVAPRLRRIDITEWPRLAAELPLSVCQTPQWLGFLEQSQQAEPVVAEVLDADIPVGYFVGAMVRRAGLRILGSPLRGWTTSYMGFAWRPDAAIPSADSLLRELRRLAFRELGCAHLELMERGWSTMEYAGTGFSGRELTGYELNLNRAESELFAAMSPACRRCIRRFDKLGCRVEEATDVSGFVADYHRHISDVFGRQRLPLPYPPRRVEQLIAALHPAGMLLLLRALDPDGRCIGASIYPGHGSSAYFWGGASHRDDRQSRPNEAMMWHAIRHCQSRGAQRFDMGGGGGYKAKYGGVPIAVPWMRASRNVAVGWLRSGAEKALILRRRLRR